MDAPLRFISLWMILQFYGVVSVRCVGKVRHDDQHILSMREVDNPRETCDSSQEYPVLNDGRIISIKGHQAGIQPRHPFNSPASSSLSVQVLPLERNDSRGNQQVEDEDNFFFQVLNDPPYMGPLKEDERNADLSSQVASGKSFREVFIDILSTFGGVKDFSTAFVDLMGTSASSQAKAQINAWNQVADAAVAAGSRPLYTLHSGKVSAPNANNESHIRDAHGFPLHEKLNRITDSDVKLKAMPKSTPQEQDWKSWMEMGIKHFFDRLDKRIEEAGGHIMLMDLYDSPL